MFSVHQKRAIADALQGILRATHHPELPVQGEVQFKLHVDGAHPSSWADIQNNGAVTSPGVNPHNEAMAMAMIADIAEGSTTANSLPHIAKIARSTLTDDTARDQEITRLREALRVIAGGYTDKDAPSLHLPPAEFRSAMWTWSQKKAKDALAAAPQPPQP